MGVVPVLQQHIAWIAPPVFVVAGGLLVFVALDLSRLGERNQLARMPIAERQSVPLARAGEVALFIEAPRGSMRFASVTFRLKAEGSATPVASSSAFFALRSSGIARVRLEVARFAIEKPGTYVLELEGLGAARPDDAEHGLILARPYLAATVARVLALIACAGLAIASLVLFILRSEL